MRFGARSSRTKTLAAASIVVMFVSGASTATAQPTQSNVASARSTEQAVPDEIYEEETPLPPNEEVDAGPITHRDLVAATRDGLRRSAIGSGIRRLRMLDYILIGGVSLLLILTLVLLGLIISLRRRIAALATPSPRIAGREDDPAYAATPLP